jgi:hypothetical protein
MTVTESLVDAKDAAVEARLESKIERAVAALERRFGEMEHRINQHTIWVVGWVTLVGGLIITVVLNQ